MSKYYYSLKSCPLPSFFISQTWWLNALLVEKTIYLLFSLFFLYLLNNEKTQKSDIWNRLKTRLYFLWNITTLVKNKHVWTCLKNMFNWNVAPHTILFTEISYKWTVSPCRYYEKQKQFHYCISLLFLLQLLSLIQKYIKNFESKKHKTKVQIQVFSELFGKKLPTQ